jgi:hypothetical protein
MDKNEKLEFLREHLEIFYALRGKMDAETNALNEKQIAHIENILSMDEIKPIKKRKKKIKIDPM